MKILRSLFLPASIVAVLAAATPVAAQPLQVGIQNSPPMGGTTPSGYCFDLMTEIAARMDLILEYRPMAFGELIPAITGGNVDIICSLISASNNWRAMGLAFSSSILSNAEGLVVPATDTTRYTALTELQGQPVGTVAGAALFRAALEAAGIADIREFPNGQALYEAVLAGEVKAGLTSTTAFRFSQMILGNWQELRLVETFVPLPSSAHHAALGVRSTETELLGLLQAALEGMKADGTLTRILEAWALPPPVF